MKLSFRGTMLAATAVSTALAALPALSQTVGVNSAVRNNVKVKATASAAETQARVKERVNQGNDITTAAASALQILLLDRSGLTVGPSARLKVDRFVYDPNKKASAMGISIAKGAFRFMSGKPTQGRPGQTALNTPTASIGIRGTMVEGAVGEEAVSIAQGEASLNLAGVTIDPQTASMIVLRGPGKGALRGEKPGEISVTAGGRTIIVNSAGKFVFVPAPGAAPMGPFQLSNAGFQQFDSVLRTQPSFSTMAQRQQQNQQSQQSQQSNSQSGQQGSQGSSGSSGGSAGGGAGGGAAGGAAAGGGAFGGLGALGGLLGLAGLAGLVAAVSSGSNSPG